MVHYLKREIEEVVLRSSRSFPAVAITGPRQSGKTTLLKHLFSESHQFVTFDDPLNRERALTDPELFLSTLGDKIILDEIQYVPELLSYIKMSIDEKRDENGRFLMTGSQQFHLMKNLGDSLAGRIALLNLLPLSLREVNNSPAIPGRDKPLKNTFVRACLTGLFPEIALNPPMSSEIWFGSYLQTYLERDVRSMANIGDLNNFQKFVRLLAARCAQTLNLSSISKELGVSANTLKNWTSILEAGHIIYLLPAYFRNLGKRIVKSPKIYFLDVGLVSYLTGIRTEEHLLNGPLAGPLFENFVIQEVIKKFYNFGKRPNIYYLRTHNQLEVDLIVENGLNVVPVEIKLSQTINLRMAKPISQIKKLFPAISFTKGVIISLSDKTIVLNKDVELLPFVDFLDKL